MCTAITLQSAQNENFFGRTMDFSYEIDPQFFIISNNYQWTGLVTNKKFINKYRFLALGQKIDNLLGFFDGVNEHGLAAAALYFDGYANFNLPKSNRNEIASVDFLHYILGNCRSINDLKQIIKDITIVGFEDPVTNKVAPLHWFATDRSGKSVVIEQTDDGLHIYDNEIGVCSNSPDFKWHVTNLRNYISLSRTQTEVAVWNNLSLRPFSQGGGTVNLPGGYTSPERFVRTSFLKSHTKTPENRNEAISTCFHIMKSVFIPKGVVITQRGSFDYTKYTAFISTETCQYFLRTYDNDNTVTVSLD